MILALLLLAAAPLPSANWWRPQSGPWPQPLMPATVTASTPLGSFTLGAHLPRTLAQPGRCTGDSLAHSQMRLLFWWFPRIDSCGTEGQRWNPARWIRMRQPVYVAASPLGNPGDSVWASVPVQASGVYGVRASGPVGPCPCWSYWTAVGP